MYVYTPREGNILYIALTRTRQASPITNVTHLFPGRPTGDEREIERFRIAECEALTRASQAHAVLAKRSL